MLARDVMTSPVATVPPDMPVVEVAQFLLERRISAAPVVDDDGRLLGIVSEGDLLHRPETGTLRRRSWWLSLLTSPEEQASEYIKTHGRRAADVMTREVVTVHEDTPLDEVAELLEKRRIKRVPVVRGGELVGIVSRADILRALASGREFSIGVPSADDRTIRQQLLDHLAREGLPHTSLVNVVVTDGVVHLWGIVETDEERQAMRVAAETIPGVRAVENHLVTRPWGTGGE